MRQPVGPCVFVTPWNFPIGDGHAQDRPGDRRGLHDGRQARAADASVDARARRRAGRRPACPTGVLNVITAHHSGAVIEPLLQRPAHTQAVVHRLHRGRSHADRPVGRAGPARVDGAGRQRPVRRVRGRRPRCRRGGRPDREAAQRRRGVHGGQPLPRARVARRGVRPADGRAHGHIEDRSRHRAGRGHRPADRRPPARDRRGAGAGCRADGAQLLAGGARMPGPGYFFAPTVLADGARRRAHPARGGVRARRSRQHVLHRGAGDRGRQRHRVRARRLHLHARPRPHATGIGGDRGRA